MSEQLSPKGAERTAYRLSTSQDGLYDIFLGTLIILVSTLPWLDEVGRLGTLRNVIVVEALALLVLGSVLGGKKWIITPRIGQVRYGAPRKKRLKRLALGMGVIFYLPWATAGALVVLIGAFTFAGFLKEYPIPVEPIIDSTK